MACVQGRQTAFAASDILRAWRGDSLFSHDPEKVCRHFPPVSEPEAPAFQSPPKLDRALDPNLFNHAFLTISPPGSNIRRVSLGLGHENRGPKVLETPIHQCIPQFAKAKEQLYKHTILKTRLPAAPEGLSARKEAEVHNAKGIHRPLSDRSNEDIPTIHSHYRGPRPVANFGPDQWNDVELRVPYAVYLIGYPRYRVSEYVK